MVKFNKYNVTNGAVKARVSYSLDNCTDGRSCVTIYARDYTRKLGCIMPDDYANQTDLQADYFDTGTVRLFPDHPLYAAARARAVANSAAFEEKQAAKSADALIRRLMTA